MSLPSPTWDLVTLNGVDLQTPAWLCLNSNVLLSAAPRSRSNSRLAGVAGEVGRRATINSRTVDLNVLVTGQVDPTGVAFPDPIEGLEANIAALQASVYDVTEADDGAVSIAVERRSGEIRAGRVQLNDFVPGNGIANCVVAIEVLILGGTLLPVGS